VLNELGDKVPTELRAEVQAVIEQVKKIKDSDDEPAIRKAVDALSQVVQKIGAAAYQQQPPPPPAGGEPEPGQEGPEVVDGEAKDA
jgi:molecular chaperone DnaK